MLGVTAASAALVLSAAGSALACNIKDFSAEAKCVGNKGVITVTVTDPAGVPAIVTVYLENNNADVRQVGQLEVQGSKDGTTISFAEDWEPGATYRIHVTAGKQVDADISPNLTTPSKACTADTSTPSAPPSSSAPASTPTGSESQAATPTPSGSTAPADAPAASNAPSAAAGDSNLAETGASSSTGLIAAIAAVFVVIGGAAVFFGMRRRGASRR
jgi:LPXTG-motif cell wall-anchored protein